MSMSRCGISGIRTYLRLYQGMNYATKMSNPIEESMRNKLTSHFQPTHLEIINESYMHNVPKDSETHFKVVVVSNKFQDQARIKKHRMVNELLKEELQNGVHALSIIAETDADWQKSRKIVEPSPNCRGGFGK